MSSTPTCSRSSRREFRMRRRATGGDRPPSPLNPAPDSGAESFVLVSKHAFQPRFFEGNHGPVHVRNHERKKQDRIKLLEQSRLAEIRQAQTDIHRVSSEAVRSP